MEAELHRFDMECNDVQALGFVFSVILLVLSPKTGAMHLSLPLCVQPVANLEPANLQTDGYKAIC